MFSPRKDGSCLFREFIEEEKKKKVLEKWNKNTFQRDIFGTQKLKMKQDMA